MREEIRRVGTFETAATGLGHRRSVTGVAALDAIEVCSPIRRSNGFEYGESRRFSASPVKGL